MTMIMIRDQRRGTQTKKNMVVGHHRGKTQRKDTATTDGMVEETVIIAMDVMEEEGEIGIPIKMAGVMMAVLIGDTIRLGMRDVTRGKKKITMQMKIDMPVEIEEG